MLLYPDLNFEKPEEQKEQRNRQNDFQRLFAEEFLGSAAQHAAHKSADDNGNHQPHIRIIVI